MKVLYFFTGHHFDFETKKLYELFASLSPQERTMFYFDHRTINWGTFFKNGLLQSRRHLLREDDSTMPKAQEYVQKLYYYDLIVKAFWSVAVLGLIYNITKVFVH